MRSRFDPFEAVSNGSPSGGIACLGFGWSKALKGPIHIHRDGSRPSRLNKHGFISSPADRRAQ